jgi:two-component system sensor histidine kinase/response regulator
MKPKIILIASHDIESFELKAKEYGLDSIITKTGTRSDLFNTILETFSANPLFQNYDSDGLSDNANFNVILENKTALVIDDSAINLDVMRELLKKYNILAKEAQSGYDAIAILEDDSINIDFILVDLQMPKMDGYQTTKLIRANPKYAYLPIIALSADAISDVKSRCIECGMNDYLSKPIKPQELFKTISYWFGVDFSNIIQTASCNKDSAGLDAIAGLNIDIGLENVGNDTESYIEILTKFYEIYKNEAIVKNSSDMQSKLHTLKGVLGNIGALNLYELVVKLEFCVKNKELERIDILYYDFSNNLQQLLNSIGAFLKSTIPQPKEEIFAELNNIKSLIENYDVEALSIFNKFKSKFYKEFVSNKYFDKLGKQLASYDFINAKESISKLETAK